MFNRGQKARLFSNIAESMQGVPRHIIDRQLEQFKLVDPAYATGVQAALANLAEAAP